MGDRRPVTGLGNRALARALSGTGARGRVIQRVAEHDLWDWQDWLESHQQEREREDLAPLWEQLGGLELMHASPRKQQASVLITALNQRLLDQTDLGVIFATAQRQLEGYRVTLVELAEVKRYDFDSDSVLFTAENYFQWQRMAHGRATVDDLRFLLHELVEVRHLKAQNLDFDPTSHHGLEEDSEAAYRPAHLSALKAEAQFLADAVNSVQSFPDPVTWQQVAVSDPLRADELASAVLYEDGRPAAEALNFEVIEEHMPDLQRRYFSLPASQILPGIKGSRAPVRYPTSVYSFLHGAKRSSHAAQYWRSIGFEAVPTSAGPVWTDPRNRAEAGAL